MNYLAIDVRTQGEWQAGHLDKALHLPLNQFAQLIEGQVSDKNQPLAIYCQSGVRAAQAVALAQKLGYKKVVNVGGILQAMGQLNQVIIH